MSTKESKKDWSATQYLKFANERTRPVHDLISQITPLLQETPHPRIYDLGCGPGNSTSALQTAFPTASQIAGLDSSPDMLQMARKELPDVSFQQADLESYTPAPGADLLFSNAVFHWLRRDIRIPTLNRMFETLSSGGVLAFQMPDNYDQPSHRLMRDVAAMPGKAWSQYFEGVKFFADVQGNEGKDRPDLDPIESIATYYNALISNATYVNIWRTEYQHILNDAPAIVEWVRGTGLQPFLHRIPDKDESARKEYVREYEKKLEGAYQRLADGKVVLAYPRFFLVAVRK